MMTATEINNVEQKLIRFRRSAYRDFRQFRLYYFPHYHKNPDAPFHGGLATTLNDLVASRPSKLALAAPRHSAKSTIITLQYVVYCVCFHLEELIVIVSSTAERATEYLSHVKQELETNERLRKDFPEVCELDKKPEPLRWSKREIITKNNVMVTALSVGQNIRGKRHNQHRPTLVVLDDIEGNDMVQNEDSRYKLKDWFEKSVLKAGQGKTNFIFAGTIHHYGSLLAQYTDRQRTPGWDGRIFRSVIKWSEAIREWETWRNIYRTQTEFEGQTGPDAAKAFFEANRDAMLAGTDVLWPQRTSYYDLMVMREVEGEISFDSEMQNEPVNPRDSIFKVDQIQFWDDRFPDEAALIGSMRHPIFFAACDPSLGKFTTRGDFSAIITAVKDTGNNPVHVLDVDLERRQPENLIDTLIGYVESRDIGTLALETNGFQQLLVDELEKKARNKGLGLTIKEVEHRRDKVARIQTLEPFLKTGRLLLSRRHRALIEQLKYFPKGLHDDGPDALQMLYEVASQYADWSWVG